VLHQHKLLLLLLKQLLVPELLQLKQRSRGQRADPRRAARQDDGRRRTAALFCGGG
jgi:hypothetical protein